MSIHTDTHEIELARLAYNAYGETTGFKNFQGNPMPEWEQLPDVIRTAWRASARSTAEALASGRVDVVMATRGDTGETKFMDFTGTSPQSIRAGEVVEVADCSIAVGSDGFWGKAIKYTGTLTLLDYDPLPRKWFVRLEDGREGVVDAGKIPPVKPSPTAPVDHLAGDELQLLLGDVGLALRDFIRSEVERLLPAAIDKATVGIVEALGDQS